MMVCGAIKSYGKLTDGVRLWFLDYPENHHIREKIRQQLQLLRDKGIIEFVGRGRYKKC